MARIIDTATLTPEVLVGLSADDRYWIYNGLDCCLTDEIMRGLDPMMDPVARKTYEFSKSLQGPVLDMTLRGLLVNQRRRSEVMNKFRGHLHQIEAQFYEILTEGIGMSRDFNWRSPKQMNELLYDVLGLPVQRKRNSNGIYAPSSDRQALETLANTQFIAEPIVAHVLALRDIGKSLGFLETGIDADGRMRTNINIAGTNTGRFASSSSDYGTGTNLQNVARDLRSVFCADKGWKFANLDLEQADARNLGALIWNTFVDEHGEEFAGIFLDACEGGDLHTFVCKMCNPQLPWNQGQTDRQIADMLFYRDKTYRDGAKVLGHGSNYLGQPGTMAKHTKFPVNLVREFQSTYFAKFPAIPAYHANVLFQLKNFASLTTLFGRRRFFFGRPDDAATLREAVAYSPQSMTGDEINTGILNLWRANKIQLLIQVHDSILFQYREEEEDEIIPWALEALKAPVELKKGRILTVPTEAQIGWNWGYGGPDNPDGLIKWKGSDSRKRVDTDTRLSIRGL